MWSALGGTEKGARVRAGRMLGALKIRMRSSQASFPPRNLPLRLGSCLDLPLSALARLTSFRNFPDTHLQLQLHLGPEGALPVPGTRTSRRSLNVCPMDK